MNKDEEYERLERLEKKVDDIIDNHLNSIWCAIEFIFMDIKNLRWFIVGSAGVLGLILALLEIRG